jgi:hypothetical protein
MPSAKENKSSKWWFYTPKESNKGWVVIPDSGAAACCAVSSTVIRHDVSGVSSIKGAFRDGSLLSGADAVDSIGQQVCPLAFLPPSTQFVCVLIVFSLSPLFLPRRLEFSMASLGVMVISKYLALKKLDSDGLP